MRTLPVKEPKLLGPMIQARLPLKGSLNIRVLLSLGFRFRVKGSFEQALGALYGLYGQDWLHVPIAVPIRVPVRFFRVEGSRVHVLISYYILRKLRS